MTGARAWIGTSQHHAHPKPTRCRKVPDVALRLVCDKFAKLTEFLEQELEVEGLGSVKIDVDEETGCRGLFCVDDEGIAEGEYILSIPLTSAVIVYDSLSPSSPSGDDGLLLSDHDSNIRDALHFLQHYASDPFWKPYMDCLPQLPLRPTPDFWEPSIVKQLQIPRLVEESLARREAVHQAYNNSLSNGGNFTIDKESLQRAVWWIRSRQFTTMNFVTSRGQDDQKTAHTRRLLLPGIDMLNHEAAHPNADVEVLLGTTDEDSMYAVQATRDIAPGEQITIEYLDGRATSLDLLDKYGFWLGDGDNPADELIDWRAANPQWTSTLAEDEARLASTRWTDEDEDLRTVISFRAHLKRLQQKLDLEPLGFR